MLLLCLVKTYFRANLPFRLVETYFLSSRNSILLIRAFFLTTIMEIRGNQFFMKSILLLVETIFFNFLAGISSFFGIVETYFSTNVSFRVVKTDFLANTNYFLYLFSRIRPVKAFLPSSGKESFFEQILHSSYWDGFFLYGKPSTLIISGKKLSFI